MKHTIKLVSLFFAAVLAAAALYPAASGSAASPADISGKLEGKKKYLREAIVYIGKAPGKHAPSRQPAKMDQQNHKFLPSVLPIVKGSTVRFLNNDPEAHNVFSPEAKYNLGNWTKGGHKDFTFKKEGAFTQLCKLHPSMIGHVLVLQNPYFARAGEDGSFRITGVPQGKYELEVWQERGEGGPTPVTVGASGASGVMIKVGKRKR